MADFATTNSKFFTVVNVDADFVPRSLKQEYYLPPSGGLIGAVKADGTTIFQAPDGTISANLSAAGVSGLAANPAGTFLTGNIRLLAGNFVNLVEDTFNRTITINVNSPATTLSYIQFTGSGTGGAGQVFTNLILGNYTDARDITLTVNGVVMTPLTSYTLSGTNLTVLDYLSPSAILTVIAKSVGSGSTLETIAGLPVTQAQAQSLDVIQVNTAGSQWDALPAQTLTDGGTF